jgi:hypothetical protein
MNFKSIALKATVAAAVVAGSALGASSAQALNINSDLNFTGSVEITDTGSSFKFDFLKETPGPGTTTIFTTGASDGDIGIGAGSGLFSEAAGGAKIKDVSTSQITDLSNFISGLLYNNTPVSFTLTKVTDSLAGVFNKKGYNLFNFDGFFTDGTGKVLGTGAVSAQFAKAVVTGTTTYSGSFTPVPTPALLPGLLALGAGVLRKRKAEATEEVQADA